MTAPAKPEPSAAGGDDPSMEDILASIRRILTEEQAPEPGVAAMSEAPEAIAAEPVASEDVLMLDSSMMIADEHEPGVQPVHQPAPEEPPASLLVAPEAAAAASASVGNLIRTLANDRGAQISSGGPTIEDVVRAELRPLLREWLNANLPPLVERVVRAEIERVLGRAMP